MKKQQERKQQIRESSRPDVRTLRVLARLEATSRRYERAVERIEQKMQEITPLGRQE